jgi:perosamine synthetase
VIPVYKPYINENVLKYAHNALDSTWVSSKGKYILEVENEISKIHDVGDVRINKAIVTNNGTSATHLVAKLLNKEKPKINKIIVPNNVYVAAWNSFLFDGKFELQAIDADLNTWNWDNDKLYEILKESDLEKTALLVVHNVGNIVNVPKILRDWNGITIVEDNCEGFLGSYEGKPSGSLSFASSISFFGNKNITSGEGGAVITRQRHQGYLYKLRSQGQSETRFIHNELGYNYRMTNVQAALLYGQIESLDKIILSKKNVFRQYKEMLSDIDEVEFQALDKNTNHSNWMFGIRVKNNNNYNGLEKFFSSNYIDVRPMFYPIHKHDHLKATPCYGGTSIAEQLNRECVILPSYPSLEDHEIAHIATTLKQYLVKDKK